MHQPLTKLIHTVSLFCRLKTTTINCGGLLFVVIVAGLVSNASAADSFRIDGSTVNVPTDLSGTWKEIKQRESWARANNTYLVEEGKFVRFLGRHYVFNYRKLDATETNTVAVVAGSPSGVAIATSQNSKTSTSFMFTSQATWFVAGNCVTMTQDLSKVIDSKREALEAGLGQSLEEIQNSLSFGKVVPKTTTVLWAQFRRKSGRLVSWPVVGLAPKDKELLMPLAEIAKDHFENVLLPTAECVEVEDPRSQRELLRSGGRRMAPSASQLTQSDDFPPPTGRAKERSVRTVRPIKGKDKNPRRSVERFGILITKFEAVPSTLTFRRIDSFVRCIRAANQSQALVLARKMYRTYSASPNERRVSYRFARTDSDACSDKGEGAGTGESGSDLADPSSTDGSEESSKSDTKPETIDPVPDPQFSNEETGEPEKFDLTDLEAVPG